MTITDLKDDIISSISELSDVTLLTEIKNTIRSMKNLKPNHELSLWKGADLDIREGVTFDQIIKEQDYKKISFIEFISDISYDDWEVSLDVLLSNSN